MNILVICQYYYPEPFRITDICEELSARGHNVTVLSALPNYPEGEIYNGYKAESKLDENVNGVHVIRCKARPRHKGTINLGLSYLSYMRRASKRIKDLTGNFDIVYVYQLSPVLMGFPALKAKRKFKIPLFLYCLDLWPESIKDVFPSEKSIFYKIVKFASRHIYQNADVLAVKCQSFMEYLERECGIHRDRMIVLPEHAEDTYLSIDANPFDNGIVDFVFLGNIGISQDCDVIVKAVSKLDSQLPFLVHFVGDGSMLDKIKRMVSEYGLKEKIVFHGRHPLSEMPKFYKLADVCLLTLSNDSAIGFTVPAKLTGYMAAGRPVVASISGDATAVLSEAECGFYVEAGDVEGLSLIMLQCLDNSDKLLTLGENGRRYFIKHYTKKVFIEQLEQELFALHQQASRK